MFLYFETFFHSLHVFLFLNILLLFHFTASSYCRRQRLGRDSYHGKQDDFAFMRDVLRKNKKRRKKVYELKKRKFEKGSEKMERKCNKVQLRELMISPWKI